MVEVEEQEGQAKQEIKVGTFGLACLSYKCK